MLKRITIQGFKAIKNATLDLGPFTVLVGRNGSGKSSLVEALQWWSESLESGLDAATRERFRAIDDLVNRRCDSIVLDMRFQRGDRAGSVHYSVDVKPSVTAPGASRYPIVHDEYCGFGQTNAHKRVITTTKGGRGPAVRRIRSAHGGRALIERDGDVLALSRVGSSDFRSISAFREFARRAVFLRLSPVAMARPAPLAPPARSAILDEQGERLVALLDSMSAPERKKLSQRVAGTIGGLTRVDVVKRGDSGWVAAHEKMIFRGGSRAFDIPSWLLSEGTRRIIALFALTVLENPPSLLVVEEIENGLDPWTLELVLDALNELSEVGTQVILTTHSPFFLDRLQPEQVIHVQRARGETIYMPITELAEVKRYERSVPPGAMYVSEFFSKRARRE